MWESVGGEMFETCIRALANNGRLVVIGKHLHCVGKLLESAGTNGDVWGLL